MPVNHTQNNNIIFIITLIGSEFEWAKMKKKEKNSEFSSLNHFKSHVVFSLLFLMSFVAQFHGIWEICIKDKLSTKSKTDQPLEHFYTSKTATKTNITSKPISYSPVTSGKIGLNFGFWSPV